MKIEIFQVDAFASRPFEGNPAAICPLDEWLDDQTLQNIAEENNLSETAFFVARDKDFHLRWFTPAEEVDLCGHATLAAAHVLYQHLGYSAPQIVFNTRSGPLTVQRGQQGLQMDFPASPPQPTTAPDALLAGLGVVPVDVLAAFDYIVVLDSEEQVRTLSPDLRQWLGLDLRGVVVTAPGNDVDFVSRCFYPQLHIDEDPVTGSAHCELAPYWGEKLKLSTLSARQLSRRTGQVSCELTGDRVILGGTAADYLHGHILI